MSNAREKCVRFDDFRLFNNASMQSDQDAI